MPPLLSVEVALAGHGLLCAGISNVDIGTLTDLVEMARIQPSVVQCNSDILRPNRDIMEFCEAKEIQFQVQMHMRGIHILKCSQSTSGIT